MTAAALVSGTLAALSTGPAVEYKVLVLNSRSGMPLRVVYVLPSEAVKEKTRTRPAVVAIPPYSIPPEAMSIICVELARRGAACAIPDFFGKNKQESRQHMGKNSLEILREDILTIIYSLWSSRFLFVDRLRTGVCGHSVGGTVAYLAARAEPHVRACVPIGMVTEFFPRSPQNLLFLSGLYDEIHWPSALLDNLSSMGLTSKPERETLYGRFQDGSARKVAIIPTADHFIETFDPFLIRELLEWFAAAFNKPELGQGPLLEWRRRVASFLFMLSLAALYGMIVGRFMERSARRYAGRCPEWLFMRVQAIPAFILVGLLYMGGKTFEPARPLCVELILGFLAAQEFVSFRSRKALLLGRVPPFRRLKTGFLLALILGGATLLSFGLVSVPYYVRWPDTLLWYPVFCLEMAVLFPLEVFGRTIPFFFSEPWVSLTPRLPFYLFLVMVGLFPGLIVRALDRLAEEAVLTVRAITTTREPERDTAATRAGGDLRLKGFLLALLLALLAFLAWRRVQEGMLNPETAKLVAVTLLRFAILPFLIWFAILRTSLGRKLARLE